MLTGYSSLIERNNDMENQQREFSDREMEVARLLVEGKSNSHIALQLGVSTRAVELHLTRIYEKLGVSSRAEAIIKLIHLGVTKTS